MVNEEDIKRLFKTIDEYKKFLDKKDYENRAKDYTEEKKPATGHTCPHIPD